MRKQGRVREGEGIIPNPAIMPKRGGGAIPNFNEGDVSVGGELIVDNFLEVRRGRRGIIRKNRFILEKPFFPRSLGTSEKLVHELQ